MEYDHPCFNLTVLFSMLKTDGKIIDLYPPFFDDFRQCLFFPIKLLIFTHFMEAIIKMEG